MSAVAGFIADSQACANPGLGPVSAGPQCEGQAWSGGIAAPGASPVQDGTANGGSNWRAQFMALVQGADTPVATDTATGNAATDPGEAGTESAAEATAVKTAPAATSAFAAESALRWRLIAAQGNEPASAALPAAAAGHSALRTLLSADRQNTADSAAVALESTQSLRPATAHETAKRKSSNQETDAEKTVSATAQASAGNDLLAQVVPQAATWAAGAGTTGTAPQQVQPDSPSASATGTALSLLGKESAVSPSVGATTGSAYTVASDSANRTGDRAMASIASPVSTEGVSPLTVNRTLPAGVTSLDNSPAASESSSNDGLDATPALSDTVQAQAVGTQNIVDAEQPQIAARPKDSFDARVAASTSAGQVGSSTESNLEVPETKPVTISTSAQSGSAVAAQDEKPILAGQPASLATAATPLPDGSAATRAEADTAGDAAEDVAGGLSESKAHTELAFTKTVAHSGQTASQIHAVVPATTGETNTVSESLGEADAAHSADTKSTGAAVSSSAAARPRTTDAQQPFVQGQDLIQAQVVRHAAESASAANSSLESSQATGSVETAIPETSAALSKARKPAGTGTGSEPARATAQPASSATAAEPVVHLVHAQTGATISEAANLQGYMAVARDAAGTNSGTSLNATKSSAGPAGEATFAALDSTSGSAAPSWTHVSARHAEAGFQDPSLGWVSVRADVNAGAVHATVVPGSADAAQTLGGHMAGLNSYLSDEHAHVETLTLAVPESKDAWTATGQGSGQGMNQGANQEAGQGNGQNHFTESTSIPQSVTPAIATAASDAQVSDISGTLSTNVSSGQLQQGSHISVMA